MKEMVKHTDFSSFRLISRRRVKYRRASVGSKSITIW